MTRAAQAPRRWLIATYALIAAAALLATWSQNIAYFGGGAGSALWTFLVETKANPASRSITVDIGFFLLAAAFFMVLEARRLGVRFVWLYILFGFIVAISVTFPLFLIARELRLGAAPSSGESGLTRLDVLGLTMTTAAVIVLTWFILA